MVNGRQYTWAVRKDEPYRADFINVFGRTMIGTTKEGWLEAPASIFIDFFVYVGFARKHRKARVQFGGAQLCSLPDPEGAEEIMTDGVRRLVRQRGGRIMLTCTSGCTERPHELRAGAPRYGRTEPRDHPK